MIFSKKTLFAAALFASSALVASAVSEDLAPTRDISGNIVVEDNFAIDLGGGTITLNGAFVSKNGSMAEQSAARYAGGDTNPLLWYIAELDDAGAFIGSEERTDTETITIKGGGSLTYTGGSLGSGYYTSTYQMNRNSYTTISPTDAPNVWNAWESMDSFWSAGNFTGKLLIEGETTLNVQGQLSQYVTFVKPTGTRDQNLYASELSGYLGVQAIELKDGATLSFAGSAKNMVDRRPNLTTLDPQDNYNPKEVLSLNFVNNLTSTSESRIVIGNDSASINRIVFNTYTGKESTVGRLSGNGRIYTTGNGTISFIGESELDPGSNVDANGNADTTGNTWISGNRLADIILGTKIVNVGSTGLIGSTVIDNVFANATAVQLVSGPDYARVNLNLNPKAGDDLANVAANGSLVNAGSYYLSNFAGTDNSPTRVYVYGNQVFNNFQSLWAERSSLLSDPSLSGPVAQKYEPVVFSAGNTSDKISTGKNTNVWLEENAVLTIKQDKGRDGIYSGNIVALNGGLVVKTGAGRFIYWGADFIDNLRIEEGEWLFSGAFSTNVTLAKEGMLTVSVGEPDTATFTIQAIDPTSVLRLCSAYFVENDLTADSLEAVKSGEYSESDLRYRKTSWSQQGGADNARGIQITEQQTLFYGKVLVEEGVTLHLGAETSSESVFSGASSIELIGSDYPDAGLWEASVLMITGTQLVRNLKGAIGSSAVRISNGGTLVLTNTDNSYAGGFAGEGNLVKLGKSNQIISSNKYGELVGSLSVLSGSVSVNQGASSVGVSGLVLKAGTSATLGSDARVGALIGEAMSAVSVNGSLTVGGNSKPSGASDGSYFATSNYDGYDNLFAGTGIASVLENLKTAAGNARLYQPGSATSSVPVTTADTLTYLKNPAKLAYKTDSNVLDGAFASLFTSTGVDQHGNDVFAKMKEGFYGNSVFGDATTIADWLRKEFTTENISNFIANNGSALSLSQKQSLTALAQTITERSDGVKGYLDSQGNLNTNGWNAIVAAGGLEYLKSKYEYQIFGMADDSLYSFITEFYSDYEFVLTQDVATQIGQIYGVDSSAWVSGNTADYGKFVESFGVSSPEFAGTLSGTGSLIKTGAETLKLTGQNSYTGTTLVKSGELFVDWNAIQRTVGIAVDEGALLTISGTDADIRESYTDPETGKDIGYETNNGYGSLFSGSNADYARLSGRGTVLKLGNGKVDLGNALADVAENASDFTGSFLVANGTLKAAVDPVARTTAQTPLAFNIYFSKETATAENPVANPSFELSFARTGGFGYIVGTQPAELNFTGVISGEGTFVLDAGVSRPNDDVASVNNILTVASEKISVSSVKIASGTLNLSVSGNGATPWFKTVELSEKSALSFDLNANAALADATIGGGNGALIVSSSETDINDAYVAKTLTLTNGSLSGVSSLELGGGATLVLSGTPAVTSGNDVVLTSLSTGAQTVLNIGESRTVELKGSGTIAGTLAGSGKFIFNGDKDSTLTLGNADYVREKTAFGGEIEFNGGSIIFAAGKDQTVSYDGLTISGNAVALDGRTIVKDGAGTVEILRNGTATNSISVADLAIDVRAGELTVSGDMFAENGGALPKSISIAGGAKFTFCEDFAGTNFDLGSLGALSGTGTLAFDLTTATTVNVSAFNASDFSGVVNLSANTTLALGANVTEFAAFSGEGKVTVGASNLTVRVDGNADGAEKFGGQITGNLQSLTVVGDGALVLGSATSIPVSKIYVGTVGENGGIGVASDWNGTIVAVGASSSVLIDGGAALSASGAKVEVQDSVKNLSLACSGELVLGEGAVATAFKLKDVDSNDLVLDGSINVTLSNVAGTALTLKKLSALNSEVFNLNTNVGGGLVFDGTPVSGSYSLRALPAAPQTVWAKDISGAGDVTVTNGANLKLAAGTLSYTGATVVSGNSALEYVAGTVSQSSSLTVKGGSTLIGGVDLVAEGSNVTFEGGSNFAFTGDAIRFTGTAVATGVINVTLDPDSLDARGVPVALIEGIGENALNKISWNDLYVDDSAGVKYLKATTGTDALVIYVATEDLSSIPGVELHEGLSSRNIAYLSEIATPEDGALKATLSDAEKLLAEAIIKTPNSSLSGAMNNLSPLSYGAMLALPQSGFISDISAISSRIEQRRYDSYTTFTWEIHDDWEFFAQAQGALAEADESSDTRTFDMNTYGAIAGMDAKVDATTVVGFSLAYDYGKADIHNSGGDIESHDVRATAFVGKLFAERFYLDAGAQAGFAMFDVKRNTLLGGVDGDTTGWHAGAFANLGMLMPLFMSEDEKTSLNLMPYIGLAYSYYGIGAFDESGAGTALDTDSFGASSLRATVGASLAFVTPFLGKNTRTNLDVAYTRELMDSEVDIDYGMPAFGGETYTASAKAFTEDSFSVGPRFSYDLDRNNSIYGGYRFEFSTDSDTAHSVNLGFRSRF